MICIRDKDDYSSIKTTPKKLVTFLKTNEKNGKKNTLIADTITGNPVVYILGYKANKYYK